MEDIYTVAQVARYLKVSPDTVIKNFSKLVGVKNMGTVNSRDKRGRRFLRIPRWVLEKYVGHPVNMPIFEPKPKGRRDWKDDAAKALAKAMNENADEPTDRETFKGIQYHARTLTFVPEEEWDGLNYFYPGEEGK
jgi:hypothetical protein